MQQHRYITKEKVCARIAQDQKREKNLIVAAKKPFPAKDDLKCYVTEIYDQGQLSSCTANALAQAYRIHEAKEGMDLGFKPSRLFIYAKERALEESTLTDAGAVVDDGLKIMTQEGCCSEESWPYDEKTVNQIPPACCDVEAVKHRIGDPFDLDSNDILNGIRHCVSELRVPVLIAIDLYASFESDDVAKSGLVPLPDPVTLRDPNDPRETYVGGHELLLVGYDDVKKCAIVCNSWSSSWGDGGYCYIPYEYLQNPNLAYSFRCFTKLQKPLEQSFDEILQLSPPTPTEPENPLAHLDGMGSSDDAFDYDEREREDDTFFVESSDDESETL